MTLPPSDLRHRVSFAQGKGSERDLVHRWCPGVGEEKLIGGGDTRVIRSQNGARITLETAEGTLISGLDFATQDYLGLAAHPSLREAAITSLQSGSSLHPAGPTPLAGLSLPVVALETRLTEFLRMGQATVFPSGSEANRTAVRTLLRDGDHLIFDAEAHPTLAAVARAAGAQVHRSPPGSVEAVERRLVRLRRNDPSAGILVAVSAVSATSAIWADLPSLISLCIEQGATLLVDVSHDLGAMGATGRGVMELEGCLGRVDVVTGSLVKTFGAAGGFVASREPGLKRALRPSRLGQWQTAALSPLQAQVILRAFDLVEGPEGALRRRKLIGHVSRLRNHLAADGWTLLGREAPFVPVRLSRRVWGPGLTAALEAAGMLVTLLAAPIVGSHSQRWRLQLRADHTAADIDGLAAVLRRLHGSSVSPSTMIGLAAVGQNSR